jgi:hypothetical protein
MASSGIFKHQKLYIDRPSWYSMTDELQEIIDACDSIKALLLSKNEKYGNSALKPVTVFSKLNSAEAIKARIDDKLSRIANVGLDDATEDTLDDLIGYLLLLKIANGEQSRANSASITLNLDQTIA